MRARTPLSKPAVHVITNCTGARVLYQGCGHIVSEFDTKCSKDNHDTCTKYFQPAVEHESCWECLSPKGRTERASSGKTELPERVNGMQIALHNVCLANHKGFDELEQVNQRLVELQQTLEEMVGEVQVLNAKIRKAVRDRKAK